MQGADPLNRKILFGLRHTLGLEAGGELALNFDSHCDFGTRRLTEGHAREDDEIFQEAHDLMAQIRDAWRVTPAKGPSQVQ